MLRRTGPGLLQERLPELVCASTVSVIGVALEAHVRQARELGWAQPQLQPAPGAGHAQERSTRPPLEARSSVLWGSSSWCKPASAAAHARRWGQERNPCSRRTACAVARDFVSG